MFIQASRTSTLTVARHLLRPQNRWNSSAQSKPPSGSLLEPQKFTCTVDHQTLYVPQAVAEALGWKEGQDTQGIKLTLHGWGPNYFAIAPTGSDSGAEFYRCPAHTLNSDATERLAGGTIESSRNPNVQKVLNDLKDK